jgi:hypothetical protein
LIRRGGIHRPSVANPGIPDDIPRDFAVAVGAPSIVIEFEFRQMHLQLNARVARPTSEHARGKS